MRLPPITVQPSLTLDSVGFKLPDAQQLARLTQEMRKLQQTCQRNGKPYITSVKGGRQTNPESAKADIDVVFVLEMQVSGPAGLVGRLGIRSRTHFRRHRRIWTTTWTRTLLTASTSRCVHNGSRARP